MKWFKVLSARMLALLGREKVIQDIDDELNVHLEMETNANIARGMSGMTAW